MKVPVTTNHSRSSDSNTTITPTTTSAAAGTSTAVSSSTKPLSSNTASQNTNISFLLSPPPTAINPTSSTTATTTTTTTATAATTTPTNHINTLSNIGYEPIRTGPSPVVSDTLPPPFTAPAAVSSDPLSVSTTDTNNQSVDLDNLDGWDSILSELGLNDDCSGPNNAKLLLSQFGDPNHPPSHLCDFPIVSHHSSFDHQQQLPAIMPNDFFSAADQFPYSNNFAPPLGQNQEHNNPSHSSSYFNCLDLLDDLIRAAQLYEVNETNQCQQILARLNQRLKSPVGKPLHRSAFYFKESLSHSLITDAASSGSSRRLTSYEIVQTIRAHKAYSGISPIPLFSTFTANQAILEAIDGSSFVHIVDFDIGFGGHWASLMREVVDKSAEDPARSIALRITAIVPEEFTVESRLVRENLAQFARDLSIVNFQIDFVLTRTFEILSFKAVKFVPGEKIAVHLSSITINRLCSRASISKFVGDLRGVSPAVIVVVDREVGMDTGTASFSVGLYTGLEFYTAVLESLDAAAAGSGGGIVGGGGGGGGGGLDWVRRIETYLISPRILAAVEGRKGAGAGIDWREAFVGLGMMAIGFSQFADFQAECLLRRAQVGGFHLAKRQGEMLLCWNDRPLVATSAWRC